MIEVPARMGYLFSAWCLWKQSASVPNDDFDDNKCYFLRSQESTISDCNLQIQGKRYRDRVGINGEPLHWLAGVFLGTVLWWRLSGLPCLHCHSQGQTYLISAPSTLSLVGIDYTKSLTCLIPFWHLLLQEPKHCTHTHPSCLYLDVINPLLSFVKLSSYSHFTSEAVNSFLEHLGPTSAKYSR